VVLSGRQEKEKADSTTWTTMTRHPLFDDHITLIRQSQSTPEESARQLYSHLTDSEKLGLLDGDIDFGKFLVDIAKHGYNFKPYCAGHVHRLGIPGIKFSDGPRGTVLGKGTTTFPVSSTRAATFNVDLEKDIVSIS
jgi:beta-glucosidase